MPELPPASPAAKPRTRRPGFWALVALVLVGHLLLSSRLLESRVGWGSGDMPRRIEVAFVQELKPAAPPAVAPVVPAAAEKRLPAVAAKAKPAASAPQPAPQATPPVSFGDLPVALDEFAPPADQPAAPASAAVVATVASAPAAAASQPAARAADATPSAMAAVPASAAASAVAFDWPPSTHLSYALRGYYRGPVEGSATVDWLREGRRYQVHLETSIGPILSRHITSEGELTSTGLVPRRFDGEQKVMFRETRRWTLRFGPERVVLVDGKEAPTMPGVQDEASQFVQLTWLFTTQPQQLQVGKSVEMPLAISRNVQRWIYDVVAAETLHFVFGEVPTFHIKPRREAEGGDLTAEIWIAPTLQYLPVRILIRDNKGSWVDLSLEKPPLQAAPASPTR